MNPSDLRSVLLPLCAAIERLADKVSELQTHSDMSAIRANLEEVEEAIRELEKESQ